jgi:hypothetical protein
MAEQDKGVLTLEIPNVSYKGKYVEMEIEGITIEFHTEEFMQALTSTLRGKLAKRMRAAGMPSKNTLRKKGRKQPQLWAGMPVRVKQAPDGYYICAPRRASRYVVILLRQWWTEAEADLNEAIAETPMRIEKNRAKAERRAARAAAAL